MAIHEKLGIDLNPRVNNFPEDYADLYDDEFLRPLHNHPIKGTLTIAEREKFKIAVGSIIRREHLTCALHHAGVTNIETHTQAFEGMELTPLILECLYVDRLIDAQFAPLWLDIRKRLDDFTSILEVRKGFRIISVGSYV